MEKEMKKVFDDVKKGGFGIFDSESKKRINPNTLAFFWDSEKKRKIKRAVVLHRDLMVIEGIYKNKFKNQDSYDLKLFEKDCGLFVERLIRAVEICTLKYVLNTGGALNKFNSTIIKGRKKFVWEH